MTDLKPDTGHLSDAQLDAIAALDVNLGDDTSIQAADRHGSTNAARTRQARIAAVEFRRGLIVAYLLKAEDAVAEPDDALLANEATAARSTLALYLVAEGEYATHVAADMAIDSRQVFGMPKPGRDYSEVPF
jgi:hypothetical protein